jgi:GNAT superfamily N-acetyltransferase
MPAPAGITIQNWKPDPADADADIEMLADVLYAIVHSGAGVSFVLPFSMDDSRAFWRDSVLPGIYAGKRRVLVARERSRIVGTVQLDLAMMPNQQHRAEVCKMLVHPDCWRRGIARALMVALEPIAREENRTLLTLDTWTGRSAEQLYRSLGYSTVGVIPRFARGSTTTELEGTTIMYKELPPK